MDSNQNYNITSVYSLNRIVFHSTMQSVWCQVILDYYAVRVVSGDTGLLCSQGDVR